MHDRSVAIFTLTVIFGAWIALLANHATLLTTLTGMAS